METAPTGTGSRRDDSAHCSWLREVIPNFVNTLPRWYWTVRVLMNSRVPISGLDRPPRASRAIWASCSVSASPGESTRSGLARRETRNLQRRRDHPARDPAQCHHLISGGLDDVFVRPAPARDAGHFAPRDLSARASAARAPTTEAAS